MDSKIALSVIIVLTVLLVLALSYNFLRQLLKCHLQYLVIRNTSVTQVAAIPTSLYILANGIVLVLFRDRLERWAYVLAAINLMPLFLSRRRNIIIYYFGLSAHNTAYCILGLIAIIKGLLYTRLAINKTRLRISLWDYLVSM